MNAKLGNRLFDGLNYLLLTLCVLLCLAPFLHIVAVSLSSNGPIMSGAVTLFPVDLNFEAYNRVFSDLTMLRSLGLTVGLTVGFTVLCMVMTICAAYPLTKTELKGRKIAMYLIVFTMFFSGGIIPEYILIKQLHLVNSLWSLVLPLLVNPFYLIILITFFNSIPKSLEESAELDGCSHFGTLVRIILPLSMPAVATLSLFYAVNRWNGFMDTLFYITDTNLYPLQLKLYQLIMNSMMTDQMQMEGAQIIQVLPESLKAASIVFATVPILIVYPWLQRYFVSGIMLGSVKG
ncbi:carbohydrate ABC transporter permease [Paenibacillus mucilaginosus]|uniref:Binding-protein-dependent transport systems inner membrane component n=1 Tax=Paenibacillus mucilaginosus (strain KNP414) TaxID=1036673 RepID=F8FK52_PAEMK|nr:carbohydrate ABC transporter permease [Paenibacillus mucilaginosus]AEI44093.1 binding-protein-dependent transport systems inner membrane component [Paenibacillus mucilaginosus KNP414]MCG7212430.1 carbohydrate ABC transporter permease [Paenibacillus mucilaginosus]WDM25530.1 carbohydrate ABC transporter permease [Paenibacillus mucilaginosus]